MREELREITDLLFGVPSKSVVEAVEEEAEDVEEEEDNGEVEYLLAVEGMLLSLKGKTFPTTTEGVALKVLDVRRPVMTVDTEELEFVVPLFVEYEGKESPEVWATAEKAIEAEIKTVSAKVAQEFYEDAPKIALVKRTKTDPFKGDPRSLTMLRYRVA
jgi:hypothetical protein